MSRILSQDEIDALLSAAIDSPQSRDRADMGPAVPYNFRRPDRVSKEQMHSLQFLHERAARNLSTSLSAYLRTTIQLSVASVEQFTYQEFLATLADPTAYYALKIAPYDEPGALEITPVVAFAMIDRLLGGPGQPPESIRPLTEIEQNVVDEVVLIVLDGLAEAWRTVANLVFSIRGRETRPRMLQVAAPNEIVCAVGFDLVVGDVRGAINLCLPIHVVDAVEGKYSSALQRQKRDLTPTERAWLAENLARVPLPVTPLIRTRMRASAVLGLEPGEVIATPLAADEPLEVFVGTMKKMTGRLAAERGRLMVQIEQREECAAAGAGT